MKNKINIFMVFLTAALFALAGCTQESSDFTGEDCYFVSFSLTIDGVVYPAKLIEKEILVEVPYGVDVSKAQVNYNLNENATVLPDPSTVKDWSADQLFHVQAFNKNFNTFTYSLSFVDVETTENVILLTQAQVDEFAGKNINKINGNLIIGEKISSVSDDEMITNLDALSSLTSVNYNVIINNSYAGTDIDGLSNLKKAGGIYIGSTTTTADLKKQMTLEFPKLESVGTVVINSDSVTAISFPKIVSLADLYIASRFLDEVELPNLQQCYGNFTLTGSRMLNPTAQNSNLILNAIMLPKLSTVSGNFILNGFMKLSVLSLESLQTILGNCEVKYLNALELINYPLLERVDGDFSMVGNIEITKIVAPKLVSARSITFNNGSMYSMKVKDIILSSLAQVQKTMTFTFLGSEKLDLPKLEYVGESMVLQNASSLLSFNTPLLKAVKSIRFTGVNLIKSADFSKVENLEKIEIYNSNAMESLFLPKSISGNLTLSGSGNNDNFIDLGNLESVEGIFSIEGYTKPNLEVKKVKKAGTLSLIRSNSVIQSVSFPDLTECGDFKLNNFNVIETLSLPLLAEVNSFVISENPKLVNIAIPSLKKVKGQLNIQGNRWNKNLLISNLDGFAALTSVGSVLIQYAPQLNDFTGLKNVVEGMETSDWIVSDCKYNPTLQDMLDGNYTN